MLFFLQSGDVTTFICFLIVAFFAFAYHELGHALVANYLGDPTPRQHGRMTLNPIPHISLFGMIMLVVIGFGWAVTPINPSLMRGNPRTSHAIVAIAGPAFNLIMAILFAIPLRFLVTGATFGFTPLASLSPNASNFVSTLLVIGVNLNLFLLAFNLLPIPPLDGFWLLRGLLPVEMAYQMDRILPYGTMIFFLMVFLLPRIGIDVFAVVHEISDPLFYLLTGLS